MIDPKDIFNAHRVVGTPNQFRGRIRSATPLLPIGTIPPPRYILGNSQRRGSILRSVKRAALEQRNTIRSVIVRRISPVIIKPRKAR